MKVLLVFFLFIACETISAKGINLIEADSSDKAKKIDALMSAMYARGQFTGAVLVAEGGQVLYKKGFGLANRETGKSFTTSTPCYIGSISKQFTAFGIMLLKERGKLTYEQSIRDFLPSLPAHAQGITISNLLHHTSGLATYGDFPDMGTEDVFKIMLQQEALHFVPGEKFEYANGGYVLLGMIIEKVSGQSFSKFMHEHVFKPLGMNNTYVNEKASRTRERAIGYYLFGAPYDYDVFTGGDASVISTVEDLFRWDRALYKPAIIKKETLKEAFTPTTISLFDDIYGNKSYGLGWWISEYDQTKHVFHDGAFGGFRAFIERQPDKQNTIIQISNLRHPYVYETRNNINNILENKPYTIPKQSYAVWIYKQADKVGMVAAVDLYHDMKASKQHSGYFFDEREFNSLGYYLMRNNRVKDAIQVFMLNTEEFPQSANTFDSLGEAYVKDGNKTLAIKNYRKVLELSPDNSGALNALKELEK